MDNIKTQEELIKEAKVKEAKAKEAKLKENKLEHYDVVIECYVPAKFKYRLWAKDPEQAIILAHKRSPDHIQYEHHKRRDIKATVYQAGMSIIKWIKNIIR